MREIKVFPLPSSAEASDMENSVAVVIDVLRATSVVAYAVSSGVREIIPLTDIDEARRLKKQIETTQPEGVLLGGERQGLPIEGFDLGNSPQDYTLERVAGKTLVFTTTNGTVAMHAARPARSIFTAAFLNADAVVRRIEAEGRITILCAGTDGAKTEEDILLAGCLVARLCNGEEKRRLNSFAEEAVELWGSQDEMDAADLTERLRQSRGGRNLTALGLVADISAAAQRDKFDVVPRLDPLTMRIKGN